MACAPDYVITFYFTVVVQVAVRVKLWITTFRIIDACNLHNIVNIHVSIPIHITGNGYEYSAARASSYVGDLTPG